MGEWIFSYWDEKVKVSLWARVLPNLYHINTFFFNPLCWISQSSTDFFKWLLFPYSLWVIMDKHIEGNRAYPKATTFWERVTEEEDRYCQEIQKNIHILMPISPSIPATYCLICINWKSEPNTLSNYITHIVTALFKENHRVCLRHGGWTS